MANAPSSTGSVSPTGVWAVVICEEQGTMANTPISSGFSPVSWTARRRARMAASSAGRMTGAMLGMSLGKRIQISRITAGQAEEISGMTRSVPLVMYWRANPETTSAAAAVSKTPSKPISSSPLRTMSTSSRF